LRLARTATLEEAAALLWETAAIPTLPRARRRIGMGADPTLGLIERCQIRLAVQAGEDLAALDLSPAGVVRTGVAILDALTACVAGDAGTADGAIHRRLAAGWGLDDAGADIVRRCLVLLADHELNASTYVARCVASTGATPYAVVSAALAALSGRRHGGASASAEAFFQALGPDADPLAAMAARLARGEAVPGLGQPLYPDGDPRALAIVEALTAACPKAGAHVAAAAVAAAQLTGQYPNVDFALGAASVALGLPPGSALAMFVVARTVGWIAHAIEQYRGGDLIRPRARYTGKRPGAYAPPQYASMR
jgi:citrate synthase